MRWVYGITALLFIFYIYVGYQVAYQKHRLHPVSGAQAQAQAAHQAVASSTTVRIPIFIYHSVYPDFAGETRSQQQFSVTPEELEGQLRYLRDHGYTAISLDELVSMIRAGTTTVSKPVVLTFDDGWQNEYDYAFPLLQKYHDTATFFVFTNPIGRDKRFVTWDELRRMQAAGIVIGDHTLTHPYIQKLNEAALTKEVLGGKKMLEEKLGTPVTHFASPFGYTDAALEAILKANGFTTGRTTIWGAAHSSNDLLHLSGFLVQRSPQWFEWVLQSAQ